MSDRYDDFWHGRKPKDLDCEQCKKRPAAEWWSGDADIMAVNHGAPLYAWCLPCCIEAQLDHCRKQAARIPQLEADLAAALK